MPPPPQRHERGQPRRRRLLTLPAVCPCEAIAPAPLLASLVSLAADVAGRAGDAAAFPALRRGASVAVRIAGLLLAFLEAIRDADDMQLTGAAVLALSELHVALQKLRLLLTDLGRRGARLWVLMNAELAASELRIALGSVATAMDVLPLPRDVASGDVRELARLAAEHAWRAAAARAEPDDDLAARSVRSVLARFSRGAAPDTEHARLALRRAGVDTWSGCAEEAAFLESELLDRLDQPGGEDDGNDLALLSGLLAFAVYCGVVLFDRMDEDKKKQKATNDDAATRRDASGVVRWISPEALQCPITLELMTDPVTVATGQTYDRASIKKWMRNGCHTCPVTGERLRSAEVVPNLTARAIVEQFLISKGASLHAPSSGKSKHRCAVDKTAAPFSPAAAGGTRLTAAFLVATLSTQHSDEQLRKATHEVRRLTKQNAFHRCCLSDAGAVPWLLHRLASAPDASVQDNAVAALLNLSKHPSGRRALVGAPGGVVLVVDAVGTARKVEARQNAAAVLFYLSSDADYCGEIGRVPEAVPTLVRLARDAASYRGRKNALVSLHGLLQCVDTHARAVAAGAVPVLAGMLLSDPSNNDDDRENDLAIDAVALLARLAEQGVGARAVMASSAQVVPRVVEFLGGEERAAARSASGKEQCVALLCSLGRHAGDRVLGMLGKLPALMPALYALIVDGSPQAGKKARWLVNEIHRHYDQRQEPAAIPTTAGDRVIRV